MYVDTTDPRESADVPLEIHETAIKRSRARAAKNYPEADALHKTIISAGYRSSSSLSIVVLLLTMTEKINFHCRVIKGPNNEEILARKYRIRLR